MVSTTYHLQSITHVKSLDIGTASINCFDPYRKQILCYRHRNVKTANWAWRYVEKKSMLTYDTIRYIDIESSKRYINIFWLRISIFSVYRSITIATTSTQPMTSLCVDSLSVIG